MATESIKYLTPETETKLKSKAFPRPHQNTSGIVNWLTTIDHKKDRRDVWPGRPLLS